MKIVYITEVNLDKPSGVLKKLNEQVDSWSREGHNVYVVSIPSEVESTGTENRLSSSAKGCFIYRNKFAMNFFSKGNLNFANKFLSVIAVKRYVISVSPDIIYLREMVSFPRIIHMFSTYPVVLESNTLLAKELKFCGFGLRLFYKLFQRSLNNRVNGFIGVTAEISESYIKYDKPITTISNSIHVDLDKDFSEIEFNESINIVFVGSPNCIWHGVDKYVKMASSFPDFNFFLVGPVLPEISLPNLIQLGFLDNKDLIDLYQKIDVGIGSLALHRNDMNQACPLKVREYLSFGLPIIIAYEDTDLINQDFVLQLPNIETCVDDNLERIGNFINNWHNKRVNLAKIHDLISTDVKERERMLFLKQVAEKNKIS